MPIEFKCGAKRFTPAGYNQAWDYGEPEDTRSSYYLEDAATEFQVHGIEVDWACVTWDAELRTNRGGRT